MKVKGAPKPWDIADCSEGLRREKDFSALGAVKLTQAWNEHHHVVPSATKLYCKKTFVNPQGGNSLTASFSSHWCAKPFHLGAPALHLGQPSDKL